MIKIIATISTLTCTLVLLTGCATTDPVIVKNDVPIPIPCNITVPQKPSMPFTDQGLVGDIFQDSKNLLAEIEIRSGYETELEAAITACNAQ